MIDGFVTDLVYMSFFLPSTKGRRDTSGMMDYRRTRHLPGKSLQSPLAAVVEDYSGQG